MPISRSVYERRDGTRVVTLPKSWVENIEDRSGTKLKVVHMDVFNEEIIITPKIEEEDQELQTLRTPPGEAEPA